MVQPGVAAHQLSNSSSWARIMATQLDSVQISQLKVLALGLEYDVS